jgi:1,4-dihydroxy-2-naphthoate octaprenyltransferase
MTVSKFIAWIKLGRYLFLGGGFVFFALGSSIAHYNGLTIDVTRYILGQLIVTSTQLMVQYSNDYFDFQADLANQTPTRWSGGSRILPSGQLPPQIALYTAWGLVQDQH